MRRQRLTGYKLTMTSCRESSAGAIRPHYQGDLRQLASTVMHSTSLQFVKLIHRTSWSICLKVNVLVPLPESISAHLCLSRPPGCRPPPWNYCQLRNCRENCKTVYTRQAKASFVLFFKAGSDFYIFICLWVLLSYSLTVLIHSVQTRWKQPPYL